MPSLSEVKRKSIIARARRFFESEVDAFGGQCELAKHGGGRV